MEEAIKEAQRELDALNLEVAEYRVRHGMSQGLINLYAMMGGLGRSLQTLEVNARGTYEFFEQMQNSKYDTGG